MSTNKRPSERKDKEALARLNIPSFITLRDHLIKFPETYRQGTFGERSEQAKTACGTVCCLAGRQLIIARIATPIEVGEQRWDNHRSKKDRRGRDIRPSDFKNLAGESLGMTELEEGMLFGSGFSWPSPWNCRMIEAERIYMDADKKGDLLRYSLHQSKIAISYLNHIIKTGRILD